MIVTRVTFFKSSLKNECHDHVTRIVQRDILKTDIFYDDISTFR